MPGLRERVISIICEEWPNGEHALDHATISERLKSAGAEAPGGPYVRCYSNCRTDAISRYRRTRVERLARPSSGFARTCAHSLGPITHKRTPEVRQRSS